jgi:hypothetical protein
MSRLCVLSIIMVLWFFLSGTTVQADNGATFTDSSTTPWHLMVSMQLQKVGRHSNSHCPTTVISDLENEFRDWMVAEFDLIMGEDNYVLTRAAAADRGDSTEIQTIVKTTTTTRTTSHEQVQQQHTLHSLTLPLQWNAQTIIDQWRNAVRFTSLNLPCLGETTIVTHLKVTEVPYFPDSWTSTPIIMNYPASTLQNTTDDTERYTISTY